jgi:hypothetical protein
MVDELLQVCGIPELGSVYQNVRVYQTKRSTKRGWYASAGIPCWLSILGCMVQEAWVAHGIPCAMLVHLGFRPCSHGMLSCSDGMLVHLCSHAMLVHLCSHAMLVHLCSHAMLVHLCICCHASMRSTHASSAMPTH